MVKLLTKFVCLSQGELYALGVKLFNEEKHLIGIPAELINTVDPTLKLVIAKGVKVEVKSLIGEDAIGMVVKGELEAVQALAHHFALHWSHEVEEVMGEKVEFDLI